MNQNHRLIIILGPTAGGKSDLAVNLALHLGKARIISSDSMQVYRYMDAGTAKPTPQQRAQVPHEMIDMVDPSQRFTVADWLDKAEPLIDELLAQETWPIVVGGTNLYIKALLEGLFEGPPGDPNLRDELAKLPPQVLHEELAQIDPAAADRIHVNDQKKMIRAVEVYRLTGTPITQLQTQWQQETARRGGYRRHPILVGLDWPTPEINTRINQRVRQMFNPSPEQDWPARSLPDEVRWLLEKDLLGPQAREALGYKQVLEHLENQLTLDDAVEKTKILTRQFAKRQRTWLKRFVGCKWFPANELSPHDLAGAALSWVEQSARHGT